VSSIALITVKFLHKIILRIGGQYMAKYAKLAQGKVV